MLIKILGFADILAIIALLAASILPQPLVILMSIYLILKGIIFVTIGGNIIDVLDVIAGFYMAAASYGISHWIITSIVIIYLGQKAFISLF